MDENEVLNFKETSGFLGVHINTLRRWVKQGKISGHRIGRQWRFLKSELLEWIKKNGDK